MTEDQMIEMTNAVEAILRRSGPENHFAWACLYIAEYWTPEQVVDIYEYLTNAEADDHCYQLTIEIVEILQKLK